MTIADDHRKFVNQNQRIYDMEESMRKCIEIRAKQAFLNEEKEEKMMYELIEKKQMAAELQKVRFWYFKLRKSEKSSNKGLWNKELTTNRKTANKGLSTSPMFGSKFEK